MAALGSRAVGKLPTGTGAKPREIKLQDLKSKTPAELVSFAEENWVENASTMRKQELMFAILKQFCGDLGEAHRSRYS